MKKFGYILILFLTIVSCTKEKIEIPSYGENDYAGLSLMEKLGKKIFFDKNLSNPAGQSCASCHGLNSGFSDPQHLMFSRGANKTMFGFRNAPTLTYMKFSPAMYFDLVDSTFIGGFFWDGRVNSLEDQVLDPMLNPIEMNNSSITEIINKIKKAEYANMFKDIYGDSFFDDSLQAIRFIASAVAAYEKSNQVNPFTSKYDYYLRGQAVLSAQELRGLNLFNDTAKAKCVNCHPSGTDNIFGQALFTDFSYDNIGVPFNKSSIAHFPDLGLGTVLKDVNHNGKFKVPTLRNVELTAPYFHNGYFNTLEEVVRFYSDRDSIGLYPKPEVSENVNIDELGQLRLTEQEVQDLVAFLKTLTDGAN